MIEINDGEGRCLVNIQFEDYEISDEKKEYMRKPPQEEAGQ
jgi:hypothetical protein